MQKVLITEKLLASCEDALAARYDLFRLYNQQDKDGLLKKIGPEIKAIAGGQVDAGLMKKLPNLKMISNFGVGYDSIDTTEARKRAINVTNTPDVLNDAVAEITVGLMIALSRRIPAADAYVRKGKWAKAAFPLQNELGGKTLGIVGLGRIGRAMGRRAKGFGMETIAHDPYVEATAARRCGVRLVPLDELLERADFVSIHCVLTPETEGLIGRDGLARMKRTAFLINGSRAASVDRPALLAALREGGIAGAGFDVFHREPLAADDPLQGLGNVIATPHLAWYTREAFERVEKETLDNLLAILEGRTPRNLRNPEVLD